MSNICIQLLNSFTKKEHNHLQKFIAADIFSTDKKIYQLFVGLKKYVIGKGVYNNQLEVRIYNAVYNKGISAEKLTVAEKKQLNTLMHSLTRVAEDYISYQEFQSNFEKKRLSLYEALLKKKQLKLLQKHLNNDKKKIDLVKKKKTTQYNLSFQIENYNFLIMHQNGLLTKQDNLETISNNLDIYYILEKLSLWATVLNLEQITHRKYNHASFKLVENFIKETAYSDYPDVKVFMAMIDLLKNKTEIAYYNLLDILNQHSSLIGDEILPAAYNTANNFCSYNIKRGIFNHVHLIELYKTLDKKGLLLENGFMPITKLKNLVAVACRTKQFDFGKRVLEKYLSYIEKKHQNSVYQFNTGVINFYKNNYNDALQNFIRVDDVNLVNDINYRIMMMKAHYEVDKNYDERTVQIFRSAEKYFIANKLLSKNNLMAYKNFVRMLINLYRIKHKATKMKTSSFRTKLEVQKFNHDKNWLMVKLAELV